jgi:hypothetical protein
LRLRHGNDGIGRCLVGLLSRRVHRESRATGRRDKYQHQFFHLSFPPGISRIFELTTLNVYTATDNGL